jgi:hypothetical protein
VRGSDYAAAAALMARGYRDRWLVNTVAVIPVLALGDPELTETFQQIQERHGFTLDGLTFRNVLEDRHLDAIRERLATVRDREALLADVLRVNLEAVARLARETGYPEDRERKPDRATLLEDTRTVDIGGR